LEACVVANWIRADGIRHLHAHFGTNSADVAMLAGVLSGCPYSFTAHGPEEFDRPLTLSLGEKIRRAAFVVAISSFARSQLFRWVEYGHWDKIRIVRCGVDRAYLHASEEVGFGDGLVCVGRLCEQKGQMLLIAALHKLKSAGIECKVVLAGDGEFREQVEALVAEFNLQQQVTITGWISGEQVKRELQRARALVLASFGEGLPVVIMEAMAMGKPVISTYVAGIPELVADGETGWLIPAGDESRLAAAIEACLQTDIATLRTMGAAARKRVIAAHDVDKEAGKLAELFRSSIAARDTAVSARQHPHDLREPGGAREASGQISVKGDGTS
jgi:colanic acid/amylovoran biosynthesis glycosyltransferase